MRAVERCSCRSSHDVDCAALAVPQTIHQLKWRTWQGVVGSNRIRSRRPTSVERALGSGQPFSDRISIVPVLGHATPTQIEFHKRTNAPLMTNSDLNGAFRAACARAAHPVLTCHLAQARGVRAGAAKMPLVDVVPSAQMAVDLRFRATFPTFHNLWTPLWNPERRETVRAGRTKVDGWWKRGPYGRTVQGS